MIILRIKQYLLFCLRWSEKYTRTDMVYLARGSFWMMIRQIGVSLIAFGTAVAFANLLPKETYGAYKYVLSISILLAITTLPGVNASLTRSVARGFEGSLRSALFARTKWGLLGSFFTLVVVLYYGLQGSSALMAAFVLVALFLPFKSSFSVYQAFWQGKQRFDLASKFTIFQDIIATVPMLVVLYYTDDLFFVVLTYFISQTVASAFFYFITLQRLSNQRCDPETIPYGKHLSLSGVLFTIANNCTDIIIWHLLGPVQVAIYAFATRPPQELRRVFTEAFPIALPKFSQRTKDEIQRTLMKKIAKLYVVLIPCVVSYILIAPSIYRSIFPEYLEAVLYSQTFALSILFAPMSLFGTVFQALGRTKEIYLTSILSPLLLITALLIFVPIYGLMGAIFALLSTQMIGAVIVIYLFKHM